MTIDELLEQGLTAVEAGEFEVARLIYERGLELYPTERAVQVRLAMVLMNQEKYEAALGITRQIIDRGKGKRVGYEIAGMCHHRLGQFAEAEQMFRQAIAIKSTPPILIFLFDVLAKTDRADEGVGYLQKALELDPNDEEAHYNLGCYYRRQKQYELAEQHLRRAITIDPDYAIAYAELGAMLSFPAYSVFKGNKQQENIYTKEAKRILLRAIELDPTDGWSQLYFANLLWRMGKNSEAETYYRAVLELWPKYSIAYWCYGDFLSAIDKDHAKAGQLLRKAIELEPDDATAYYHLGKHLLRCKHKFKAKQALAKAAELGYEKVAVLLEEIEGEK